VEVGGGSDGEVRSKKETGCFLKSSLSFLLCATAVIGIPAAEPKRNKRRQTVRFEWKKELETGIPALDIQHQGIFDCINSFLQKCDEGGGGDEIIALLDSLDSYTRKHFSYEENLQRYNKYPGLEVQQKQHALFLAELAELKKTLEISGPTGELTLITKGTLIRWLSHHIKSMDKNFVEYLNAKKG
jgi:hemerythrin-like metal-binding protein